MIGHWQNGRFSPCSHHRHHRVAALEMTTRVFATQQSLPVRDVNVARLPMMFASQDVESWKTSTIRAIDILKLTLGRKTRKTIVKCVTYIALEGMQPTLRHVPPRAPRLSMQTVCEMLVPICDAFSSTNLETKLGGLDGSDVATWTCNRQLPRVLSKALTTTDDSNIVRRVLGRKVANRDQALTAEMASKRTKSLCCQYYPRAPIVQLSEAFVLKRLLLCQMLFEQTSAGGTTLRGVSSIPTYIRLTWHVRGVDDYRLILAETKWFITLSW